MPDPPSRYGIVPRIAVGVEDAAQLHYDFLVAHRLHMGAVFMSCASETFLGLLA